METNSPSAPLLVFDPDPPPTEQVSDTRTPERVSGTRTDARMGIVLFPLRGFLALGWLRAAAEKAISLDWWQGNGVRTYLGEQADVALPFMAPISDGLFHPLAMPISLAVVLAQFMIGVCFATAQNLRPAVYVAMTLNLTFLAMGSVTPSAFYLAMQLSLLVGLGPQRNRQRAGNWRRRSAVRIGAYLAAGLAMVPFISTLDPAEVIHDPALMLITIALLAACCEAATAVDMDPSRRRFPERT